MTNTPNEAPLTLSEDEQKRLELQRMAEAQAKAPWPGPKSYLGLIPEDPRSYHQGQRDAKQLLEPLLDSAHASIKMAYERGYKEGYEVAMRKKHKRSS